MPLYPPPQMWSWYFLIDLNFRTSDIQSATLPPFHEKLAFFDWSWCQDFRFSKCHFTLTSANLIYYPPPPPPPQQKCTVGIFGQIKILTSCLCKCTVNRAENKVFELCDLPLLTTYCGKCTTRHQDKGTHHSGGRSTTACDHMVL